MDDNMRHELTDAELESIAGGAMMKSINQEVKDGAMLCLKCGAALDGVELGVGANSRVKSCACPNCHQRNYFKLGADNAMTQMIFNQ